MVYRNTNNAWNAPANLVYAKDGADWKSVKQAFVNDAGTWKNIYDGISTAYATVPVSAFWYSVAYGNGYFVMAGIKSFVNYEPVVVYSTDGVKWTQSATVFNSVIASIPQVIFAGNQFVMGQYVALWQYTSTDGGVSWLSGATDSNQGLRGAVIYNPNNDRIFFTQYNANTYVWMSSNKGTNWTQQSVPAFNTGNPYFSGGSGMAIGNNGTMVMLSTSESSGGSLIRAVSAVNVSTNGGTTWSQIVTPPYKSDSIVFFNNMFIVYNNVYHAQSEFLGTGICSYDGITWNTFGGGLSVSSLNYLNRDFFSLQAKDRLVLVLNSGETLYTTVCGVNTASYPITQYVPNPALALRTAFSNPGYRPAAAVDQTTGTMVFALEVRDAAGTSIINNRVLISKISDMDSDALAYIAKVETMDGQELETSVQYAVDTFVKGCKTDNIWYAMSACCIMAGARTLSAALVPLRGDAPTNVNFVQGDYSRSLGLKGNGTDKYLNANRNNNADPVNSKHISVYQTQSPTFPGGFVLRYYLDSEGWTFLRARNNNSIDTYINASGGVTNNGPTSNPFTGFIGCARAPGNVGSFVMNSLTASSTLNTSVDVSAPTYVFGPSESATSIIRFTDARLSFYSIGSIAQGADLLKLSTRAQALMSAYAGL